MQQKYGPDKLRVVLLSTDEVKASYFSKSPKLFEKYGGAQWPSVVLPNAFNSALRFGNFGYGKLIVDADGIVRSIGEYDLEKSLKRIFGK